MGNVEKRCPSGSPHGGTRGSYESKGETGLIGDGPPGASLITTPAVSCGKSGSEESNLLQEKMLPAIFILNGSFFFFYSLFSSLILVSIF